MLSGEREDLPERLLWVDRWSSCFGGASLLMFTMRSTILFPMTTGFNLSPPFECCLLGGGTELPLTLPFGALPLDGEQDCLLGLILGPGSTDDDRLLGAPGLPRVAEEGLSGNDVLKFGGASREKPGMSEAFSGLGFVIGEVPCDGAELLDIVGPDLVTEDDRLDGAELVGTVDGAEGRLVGVADLDEGLLAASTDGLDVGVEDLTGVDDRGRGADDFAGTVVREGGVEGLVGFETAGNVERPVGVAGLDEL